jgi:hypothetical protein
MKFTPILLLLLFFQAKISYSQEPEDLLDKMFDDEVIYADATFKASRIVNGHSVEQVAAQELEFRISHRFGRISDGFYDLFGLDHANIHFSFEYGITDRLTAGIGRGNYLKTYDAFVKYKIARQSRGAISFPIHISYVFSTEYSNLRNEIPDFKYYHRFSYVHQLLLARKVNKKFSLQLTPTFIHKNLTSSKDHKNNIFSLGLGGRYKVLSRLSLNLETFLLETEETPGGSSFYIPFSIGVDLETGGHVFQIMVTNSQAMREVGFITQTTGNWGKGELHLGFNISRMFDFSN